MKKILQLSIIFLLLAKFNFGQAQIFVPENYSTFNGKLEIHFSNSDKFVNDSDVYDPLTLLDQLTQKLELELHSNQIVEGSINHFTTSQRNIFKIQISDLFFITKDTTLEYKTNRFKNFLNDYQRVFSEFEEILKNKKSQLKNSEIENINASIYLAKGIMQGMKEILVENPDFIFYVTDTTWGREFKYLLIDFQKLKTEPYLTFFSSFSEDAAYVKWRGKYGFINSALEVFIDYQYDDANLFNSGKAIVCKSGKSYFIDKNNTLEICNSLSGKPVKTWKLRDGVTVVHDYFSRSNQNCFLLNNNCEKKSDEYQDINYFSEKLLLTSNAHDLKGIIDINGKVFLEPIYKDIQRKGDFIVCKIDFDKERVLGNIHGLQFLKNDYTFDRIYTFDEKLLLVEKKGKMNLVDINMQEKLRFEIDEIEPFNKFGLAAFMKDGLWGLLNRDFKVILKPDYKSIDSFNEKGFAILNNRDNYKKENIVSVINTKGKFLSFRKYSKIDDFHSGSAKVYLYDKKQEKELIGLVDSTWLEIIPPVNEKLGQPQYDLIVGTRLDSTSSVFKTNPTIAYNDVVYDIKLKKEILPFQHIFTRGEYGAKYNLERSILFDQRLLFIPAAEDAYSFARGEKVQYFVFDIEKRSKINTTSKINSVSSTAKKDIFLVKDIEGKYGLILIADKEKIILPSVYDSIYFKSSYYVVSKSFYRGKNLTKFGIVDSLNNILVPIEFDFIKEVKNNCFIVENNNESRKKIGVYNFNSFNVVPVLFDDCILGAESIIAKKDNERFLIDYKGNCLDNCDKFKEILKSN